MPMTTLGKKLLNIHVSNSRAIIIKTALFYTSTGRSWVNITDEVTTINGSSHVRGMCAGNNVFVVHLPE